jgi:hypothetical protein
VQNLRVLATLACLATTLVACGAPAPTPTPVPTRPLATPTPEATAVPTLDPTTFDVQDEFMTNVNDLTNAVEQLATAACPDLSAETQANPTEVTEIRGFAATLQRVGSQQPALSGDNDVQSTLSDLGQAMTQLNTALTTCGINAP